MIKRRVKGMCRRWEKCRQERWRGSGGEGEELKLQKGNQSSNLRAQEAPVLLRLQLLLGKKPSPC